MILVDTSAWIDYVRGVSAPHTNLLDAELSRNRLVTGDFIMAEFLQGFRDEREYQLAKQLLDRLEYRDLVGKQIAEAAAQNYRILRQRGVTIRKTVDVILATYCLIHDLELIHNDRDFDALEATLGLRARRGA